MQMSVNCFVCTKIFRRHLLSIQVGNTTVYFVNLHYNVNVFLDFLMKFTFNKQAYVTLLGYGGIPFAARV